MRLLLAVPLLALLLPAGARAAPPGPHDLAAYPLLWRVPEMARVEVRRGLAWRASGGRRLRLDLYLPAGPGPHAVAVLVNGAGDTPGRELRGLAAFEGWARLLAAQGIAAAVPDAGPGSALADARALLAHLAGPGRPPGLDPGRLALWASSADAAVALAVLSGPGPAPAAAALLYGAGDAGRVPAGLPVLAIRAGGDAPAWNAAVDRMVAQAEERGLPWTVLRPAGLRHAFDLVDDAPESWAAVRTAVAFLRERLGVDGPPPLPAEPPPRAPGPDPAAREAMARWRAREWEGAAAAYRDWLARHPRDGVAAYRLGVSLHMLGRHAEAAERIERAVRLGEGSPAVLYNLACARARAGLVEGALDALGRALEEGFDDVEGLERDPDLAARRGSERYRRLTDGLRRRGP